MMKRKMYVNIVIIIISLFTQNKTDNALIYIICCFLAIRMNTVGTVGEVDKLF